MTHYMKKINTLIIFLLTTFISNAQEVEEFMQRDDKINVVFVVIMIILAGFVFYLFYLDRKVRKLEESVRKSKK